MARLRISLANKCQLLFGLAVLLILTAALTMPWFRMQKLVDEGQREIARKLADAWLEDLIQLGGTFSPTRPLPPPLSEDDSLPLRMRLYDQLELDSVSDPFVGEGMNHFETYPGARDVFKAVRDQEGQWVYRYLRAVRQSDLDRTRGGFGPTLTTTQIADPVRALLLIEMRAEWAQTQLRLNAVYLATAGLLAGLLAIAVFWLITTRLILSPVRVLRDTAEKVAEGDLNIRSDINTGDEFEQLSETFNTMLANLKRSQDKLRDLNKQLDLKLGELARSNLSLYEANRVKGDFLANVSHELRTPLNSIIGFAEVMAESLESDPATPASEKRRRYVDHILTSSRSLLAMISDLLDLAKIEAGRVDLHIETLNVFETCDALLNLIRPQADREGITLRLSVPRGLPAIQTDPGKFQQIIFNFLANAVKFTPRGGRVELGAMADDGDGLTGSVAVWVRDTGPGIPVEMHEAVFEKFRQLESSHTKQHGGTGLGLAISRELARMLEGRIELESDQGRGATFTLTIPMTLQDDGEALASHQADK
ncbi:MAG: HAMP domain-containing sensor histidine kinase [Phycisphaeraceae bacterium]